MSYSENMILRTCDCDTYGRWKPSAMMEAMQEVAIAHCDSMNLGRGVTDALGVVWVLSRCRVEMKRLPAIGERYTIETYAMPIRHLFFPRAHVFRDEAGEVIGGAHGLWMLMDLETRNTMKHPDVAERMQIEGGVDVKMPATVKPLHDDPVIGEIEPRFCEFDLNGHVNNTKYLDWCWNALGFDALRDRALACFDINYDREVRRGESIRTELCAGSDEITFCGFSGGTRCFGIRVGLRAV